MSSPSRITVIALATSAVSLVLAAYAVLSQPSTAEPGACDCDDDALREELASLQRRVDAAERNAARGIVRRVGEAATEPPRASPQPAVATGDAGLPVPRSPDRASPRYTGFEVSHAGVTVSQGESGALTVHNTDPALTGERLVIKARTEGGRLEDVAITVPPPTAPAGQP